MSAYEGCIGETVHLTSDGEYVGADGSSGVSDEGAAVWVNGAGGHCILTRLEAPTAVTEKIDQVAGQHVDEFDGYTVTWSWESYDQGLEMVIETN